MLVEGSASFREFRVRVLADRKEDMTEIKGSQITSLLILINMSGFRLRQCSTTSSQSPGLWPWRAPREAMPAKLGQPGTNAQLSR